MNYQGTQYVSVKFLKENDLITDESIFFKVVPNRYKLKVVDTDLFNKIQSIKESLEVIEDKDMEIPSWVVPVSTVQFDNALNVEEPTSGFDYQDFINVDFYKSMKWVGYSKRTKLGDK